MDVEVMIPHVSGVGYKRMYVYRNQLDSLFLEKLWFHIQVSSATHFLHSFLQRFTRQWNVIWGVSFLSFYFQLNGSNLRYYTKRNFRKNYSLRMDMEIPSRYRKQRVFVQSPRAIPVFLSRLEKARDETKCFSNCNGFLCPSDRRCENEFDPEKIPGGSRSSSSCLLARSTFSAHFLNLDLHLDPASQHRSIQQPISRLVRTSVVLLEYPKPCYLWFLKPDGSKHCTDGATTSTSTAAATYQDKSGILSDFCLKNLMPSHLPERA